MSQFKSTCKKLIAVTILSLSALTAWAAPSPKQIEHALANEDYNNARGMISEVLREHPNSARAHLLNAYILEHVDKNKVAANEELKQVIRLDKKGDVQGSALFGKVVAEIEAPSLRKAPEKVVKATPVNYAQKPSESGSNTIVYILLGIGVIAVGAYFYFRPKPVPVKPVVHQQERIYTYDTTNDAGERVRHSIDHGYERPVLNRRSSYQEPSPRYVAPPAPVYQVPQQSNNGNGMGMLGTAASVAGGVVAGNMVSDWIRSPSHSSHQESAYEAPTKVDYEVKESSFSSGRDDSWTSTPSYSSSSSSSSSDSWSSSSSSSSDSWSSSDSGSSGGSDW